nr:MAG: ORF1 [Torque teno midi virus]
MPFFWPRRRRYWWGRNYRRRRYQNRRRKPRFKRRRRRRIRRYPKRSRRRKRYKVRRKKKTLLVRQWQPDRIVKCKIKGFGTLVLGAEGKQMICYTNDKTILTPSKTPCGGGFGTERFTLQHLYDQWTSRNNIWTKSNHYTDLCRYLGCKFIFYRHNLQDFIINYERQPPFNMDKTTYMSLHPTQMLLGKHKKILLSKQRKTNGKQKLTIRIPPPKQMINKWFFTSQFATYDLCKISASVASFSYPNLGCCNENQILNLNALNTEFYKTPHWASGHTEAYRPYPTIATNILFWYKDSRGTPQKAKVNIKTYLDSINRYTGWFQPGVLAAYKITYDNGESSKETDPSAMAELPCTPIRYNAPKDTGEGNQVWAVSILTESWSPPTKDSDLIVQGLPLWLSLWGLASYIRKKKGDYNVLNSYIFVVKSPAIYKLPTVSTQNYFPLLSTSFVIGNGPYNSPITDSLKQYWFPNYVHQQECLNDIVKCGPYVPKLERNRDSTWELPYTYIFYFKWGGPETTDQQVTNPKDKGTYPVPDHTTERVQISNPLKQDTETLLHPWDYRRGFITNSALKRVCENIETDTDFQPDGETPKKKKKVGCELRIPEEENQEIKKCLLSLCEESSCQESPSQNLEQLIHHQRKQQQKLKHHILTILTELKIKQKQLQLHTGVLE